MTGPDLAPTTFRRTVVALLAAFTAALVALAAITPWTVDEPTYVVAGRLLRADLVWDTGTSRLHGPLPFYANQLAALLGAPVEPEADYKFPGRLGMLVFPLLAAGALTAFARALFDRTTAVAALALFASSPLVLGHGCLMGTDMSLVPFHVLALFATWRFLQRPSWATPPLLGAVIGMAFATKYLGVFLVPICGIALAIALARGFRPALWLSRRDDAGWLARGVDAGLAGLVVALVAWGTLWACYGFAPAGHDARAVTPMSDFFAGLADAPGVATLLGALPDPWVRGLDYMKSFSEDGGAAWLFGRRAAGHAGYYAVALVTKLPLAMLALLPCGLLLARRWPRHGIVVTAIGFAVPFAYLSLGQALQIGLRHMLQVIPLLCLVAAVPLGAAWRDGVRRSARLGGALVGAVVTGLVAFHVQAAPDYLGAFNALVGGRPDRVFRDSNLDWTSPTLGADPHRATVVARLGPDAAQVFPACGPRVGRALIHVRDLYESADADGRPTHWLHRHEPLVVSGPWLGYALDHATWAARADAAPTDDPLRTAAAIAWVTDPRFRDGDAPRVRGWAAAAEAPLAAAIDALLAAVTAGAPPPATALLAVGRLDLVLADATAPAYLRAIAATQRGAADRSVAVLREAAATRPLAAHEVLLLAGQLHNLQRPDEALGILDAYAASRTAAGSGTAPDQGEAALLDRLRGDATALAAEQQRIRARIGHDGRLPTDR